MAGSPSERGRGMRLERWPRPGGKGEPWKGSEPGSVWSDCWGRVEGAGLEARRPAGRPLRWWPKQGQGREEQREVWDPKDVSLVEWPGCGIALADPSASFPGRGGVIQTPTSRAPEDGVRVRVRSAPPSFPVEGLRKALGEPGPGHRRGTLGAEAGGWGGGRRGEDRPPGTSVLMPSGVRTKWAQLLVLGIQEAQQPGPEGQAQKGRPAQPELEVLSLS